MLFAYTEERRATPHEVRVHVLVVGNNTNDTVLEDSDMNNAGPQKGKLVTAVRDLLPDNRHRERARTNRYVPPVRTTVQPHS